MNLELKEIIFIALAFLLAGGLSFATTPLFKKLASTVGAVDVPRDKRRMHKTPIPRLGGLAIFTGFISAVLLFVDLTPQLQGILIGAVLIVVTGVIDDIFQISALLKFSFQIIAAIVPVLYGVRIEVFSNFNFFSSDSFINLGFLAAPLTVLWIVAITNSVNLIDGLDGLAVGVSSIACFSLLIIAILVSEPVVAVIIAALAGACIGFLPYNMNPAKIFMGDSGALFLGYILATISIQGLFKFYALVSFAVPFLILGLPIFDTIFAIVRRVAHGKSPMQADRGHLHHKLIDMGFSQKQAVAILYCISALLGLAAVVLTGNGVVRAMLLLIAAMIVAFFAAKFLGDGADKAKKEKKIQQQLEADKLYEEMYGTGRADEPQYYGDEEDEEK